MGSVHHAFLEAIEGNDLPALLAVLREFDADELGQLFLGAVEAGNTNAMYYLAALLTDSEPQEAELWLRRVLSLDPDNVKAMLHLGWLLAENGGDPAEIKHIEQWVSDADDPAAFYDFAMILTALGREEQASQCLLTAVALGEPRAREKAEFIYRQAIDDGEAKAYNSLAILLAERGELDEAEEMFSRAVDAGDARAVGNLVVLRRERDGLG